LFYRLSVKLVYSVFMTITSCGKPRICRSSFSLLFIPMPRYLESSHAFLYTVARSCIRL